MNEKKGNARRTSLITLVLAVVILVPSLFGFGSKLIEFFVLFGTDTEGIFAISPLTNYLLASAGFFMMLCWAAFNGMFRDIEQPKYDLLEVEEKLNRRD